MPQPTSRRTVFGMLASALLSRNITAQVLATHNVAIPSAVRISLAFQFKGAYLRAVSPVGATICLDVGPFGESYRWLDGMWNNLTNGGKRTGGTIRIVDLGRPKSAVSIPTRAKILAANFFAGGNHLYAITLSYMDQGGQKSQQLRVAIPSGTFEEIVDSSDATAYQALEEGVVLKEISARGTRNEALALAAYPGHQETVRVPYFPNGAPDPRGRDWLLVVSANRGTIVYCTDRWIVCRSAKDLRLLWSREFEMEYAVAWKFGITADGSRVAAAIVDTATIDGQRKFYIGVYDGKDGTPLARLPLNGYHGIALSPDGQILAVVQKVRAGNRYAIESTVHLYDVASGKQIAAMIHDRFAPGSALSLRSDIVVEFTSDGKYLISSGADTKVWGLG